MHSRTFLKLVGCAALAPLLITGCATLPREVDVPRSRIEAALARRFPYETRLGDLFVARASDPQLTLLPEANRMQLAFSLEATDRTAQLALRGRCVASFGLRFEPADHTLRLANVHVDAVELQGLPEALRRRLEPVAARVAEQLAEGAVLHTFRPEDMARAQGYAPGAIRVTPSGVSIELVPIRG